MGSVERINYEGVTIVYTNASGMETNDALDLFKSTIPVISSMPPKSVLSLVNLKDVVLSRTFNVELKNIAVENSPYVKATAICGLSMMASFIAKSIIKLTNRNAKFFDDVEEAKAWLHSERE